MIQAELIHKIEMTQARCAEIILLCGAKSEVKICLTYYTSICHYLTLLFFFPRMKIARFLIMLI